MYWNAACCCLWFGSDGHPRMLSELLKAWPGVNTRCCWQAVCLLIEAQAAFIEGLCHSSPSPWWGQPAGSASVGSFPADFSTPARHSSPDIHHEPGRNACLMTALKGTQILWLQRGHILLGPTFKADEMHDGREEARPEVCPEDTLLSFSRSVVSDSMWPHGLQHARLPCPSLSPGVCSDSWPLSQWCHPSVSSSVTPFSSHLQSFPASGSFLMSQLFTSGG